MTRFLTMAAVSAIAVLAFAAPAARAQLSENGGPVSYSADHVEYFDEGHKVVMTGDVDVVQNDSRLRANQITLYFSQAAAAANTQGGAANPTGLNSGNIERMVADGEVYYVRPAQSARGDHAVYEVASDAVTFTGNVVVASTENVIRGETMVLHISNKQTSIAPSAGGRVRGVFVPHSAQEQGTPAPAGAAAPAPGHH